MWNNIYENIKYIVDSEEERESVIINNQSFVNIQKFLKQQVVLSILDISIKVFDISAIIKNKKVYAFLLLKSLTQLFYYADKYKIDTDKYEITITDEQFGNFFGFDKKNIRRRYFRISFS